MTGHLQWIVSIVTTNEFQDHLGTFGPFPSRDAATEWAKRVEARDQAEAEAGRFVEPRLYRLDRIDPPFI